MKKCVLLIAFFIFMAVMIYVMRYASVAMYHDTLLQGVTRCVAWSVFVVDWVLLPVVTVPIIKSILLGHVVS